MQLATVSAGALKVEDLPVAGQTGPSCGFFANVPALTLATGIDIHPSRPFLTSVYGLRRGDFRFQRSFDKRMFFELFSLPYEVVEIEHPPQRASELKPKVAKLIHEVFDPGLAEGRVFSLRVIGVFGGPHNTLLLGKRGSSYLIHDPYPGRMKSLTVDELIDSMMVRSTTKKNRGKEVYVTHFLAVDVSSRPSGGVTPITRFPSEAKVALSSKQRDGLASLLTPTPGEAGQDLAARVARYPGLDFAVLAGDGTKERARSVIGNELKAKELGGVLHLAKFTLNTWTLNRRPLLPVVFMEGRPWVLVQYLAGDPSALDKPTLVFDDGKELRWLSSGKALDLIHADGACYATARVDWD